MKNKIRNKIWSQVFLIINTQVLDTLNKPDIYNKIKNQVNDGQAWRLKNQVYDQVFYVFDD